MKTPFRTSLTHRLVALGALLVTAGCAHEPTTDTTTTTSESREGPGPISMRTIDAVTMARCDREAACGNVGDGKRFPTRKACETEARGRGLNELAAEECPSGIDAPQLSSEQLQQCLADIRGTRCDSRLETIRGLRSCGAKMLCAH
jgi:hypothetical protein